MGMDAAMGQFGQTERVGAPTMLNGRNQHGYKHDTAVRGLQSGCSWPSMPTATEEFRVGPGFGDLDLGDDDELDVEQQTILVVDDDSGIRDALSDILDQLGYSVVAARDGAEALDVLRAGCQPSAVLLDLGMPTMDGREFRNELLRDPRFAELPVIVITASRDQHPDELQVTDVLTKPVQLSRLLDILESHVQQPPVY